MTLKRIPSISPHKLSAERVYRVTMALVKRLIEKGVLPPTAAQTTPTQPENTKPPSDEGQRANRFTGVLDCIPASKKYRAFGVIEGGQSETKPTPAPGGKSE